MRESLVISQKVRTFAPVLKMVVIHSVRANGNRSLGKNAKVSLFYGQPDAHRCMPSAPVITAAIQKDFGALRGTAIFRTTGCAAVPLSNRLLGVDRVMKQEQEIWKDIEGYEGKYQVSNLGRVRSLSRIINGKRFKGYILAPVINSYNHLSVRLTVNGKTMVKSVGSLVAHAFIKGYRSGLVVCHKDKNPANNHADNLKWATRSFSKRHCSGFGRCAGDTASTVGREPYKIESSEVESLDGEEWRDVMGYERLYMVSNMGRVKSFGNRNKGRLRRGELLLSQHDTQGYLAVNLSKNGHGKIAKVHRLVAMAFVDGYQPGLVVNHKDEDKRNNHSDNLEWVTPYDNMLYGSRNSRISRNLMKPVIQMTLDGEFVREWTSIGEAAKSIGRRPSCIGDCCNGRSKTAGGYKWKFKNDKK